MAVHERFFQPRWLLEVLVMLTTPCATLLARLAPSFGLLALCPSCFPLSLPYLGLGLEQLDGVALGM